MHYRGLDMDDVDEVAREIHDVLDTLGITPKLALIALCRTISDRGLPEDLDMACRIIDELSEIPRTYNTDPIEDDYE